VGSQQIYLFEVEDTGQGIDEENLAHIFVPFKQIHSNSNRKIDGAGLGLSIAKKIAEALGGSIGVRSTPGVGSTFWFKVPFDPLPPGTVFPPLFRLPFHNTEDLVALARYFGHHAAANPALAAPGARSSAITLVVGTNAKGIFFQTLCYYLGQWEIALEVVDTPALLEDFLRRMPRASFILHENLAFLELLLKQGSKDRPGGDLRVVHFSSLFNYTFACKLVAHSPVSSVKHAAVMTTPVGPVRICRAVLYLLGFDACAIVAPTKIGQGSVGALNVATQSLEALTPQTEAADLFDVLVVEDNPVNQMVMKKVLDGLNVRYFITPSGDEGLRLWETSAQPIPIVFMDVEVEGSITGLQATSTIRGLEEQRQVERKSHIIVMTGRAMDSDQTEAMQCGCNEFLTKPVNLNTVRTIVRSRLHS